MSRQLRRPRLDAPLWSTEADVNGTVTEAIARALGSHVEARSLVIEKRRQAGRSTIYVVGARSTADDQVRWLVKQPHTSWVQDDLDSPVSASEEFEALTRLHAHLGSTPGSTRVPTPVALLPELDALAMEFVPGVTVRQLLRYGSVLRPRPLLEGLAEAGTLLRDIHNLENLPPRLIDLREEARDVLRVAEELLPALNVSLPSDVVRVLDGFPAVEASSPQVVLHGDFGPGNILLATDGSTVGLDAALRTIGPPEEDLARFVTLMSASIRFAPELVAPPASRLRRRLESTLVRSYYGRATCPVLFEVRLLHQLVRRWGRARELAEKSRGGVLMPVRLRVVDAQLRRLMRESASRLATHRPD